MADFWIDVFHCRKSVDPVSYTHLHVPFLVGGTGLYISSVVHGYRFEKELQDSDFRKQLEEKSVEEPVSYTHLSGDQLYFIILFRRQQIHNGMFVIILLILIVWQCAEHFAGFHVMAVYNRVKITEIRLTAVIQENGPVYIVFAV